MSNLIEGQVSKLGEAGNLITSIANDQLTEAPRDASISIRFAGHETICLYPAGHQEPETTLVAYLGESGALEIEIVGMNLAEMLGIQVGAKVSVLW